MDHFTSRIHEKMSKVENSLLDLNNEILTTFKYLLRLKRNSTEIVSNLSNIRTPANYLKEFMEVNSFILKYLSFLTEINCKFEMLEMSEQTFINSLSVIKAKNSEVISENVDKINLHTSCKSLLDLKSNESSTNTKKVIVEPPLESETPVDSMKLLKKKAKKNKLVNSEKKQCSNKKGANNHKNQNDHNNNKSKNNKIVNSNDIDKNVHKRNTNNDQKETKNELDNNCDGVNLSEENINSEIIKKPSQDVSSPNNLDEEKSNSLTEELLGPQTILPFKNVLCDIVKKEVKQTSYLDESYYTSLNSPIKSPSDKVAFTESQSPLREVSVWEVLPAKINEQRFDAEISEYYNNIQTHCIKPEADLNENSENDIKPANIVRKLGKEYNVAMEHIQSPSEFYVSVIDQSNLLCELEKKLRLIPENKNKDFNKSSIVRKAWLCKEIGNYALFYSKCDEIWCRARITNWCLNFKDDFVSIFLIDYGETKCVSIDDLQPMPECFKKYPAFTQRCHLFNVFPSDMDNNSKTLSWEKESSEKMKFLTENSKMIKIKIAPDDCFHPVTSLPVTLWLVDQGNQCVNELLVKSRYAIQRSDFDQQTMKTEIVMYRTEENESLHNWNPMKEDFESYQNSYDLDINDPATFIYGYAGKDYERICPHFAKTGRCFKNRACRKEHQKLDPLGFTTDQEEIYKDAFNILSIPPPNSILNVQVTCILTFNQFCCIPEDRTLSFSDEEDLQSLLKFMNTAENVRQMKKLFIPPSAGQIVIARYSEDSSWYRSKVLESEPENDLYTVMFVDYGNKETLHLSDIRAIEARYLHLPFQAIRCSIFGIDRNPEVSLKDSMDYLNKKMESGHISIEIVTRLPGDDINLLVHVFDQNGRNIGEDLIAKKYSIFKKEIIISNDSLSMPG